MGWRTTGHEWIGASVRRVFDGEGTNAKVVKWIGADRQEDVALWHIRHDDGDEEDLEEREMHEALELYRKYNASSTGKRPSRVAASKSASRWKSDLVVEADDDVVVSSADEDEDRPRRKVAKRAPASRQRSRPADGDSDDFDEASDDDDDSEDSDEAYTDEDEDEGAQGSDDGSRRTREHHQPECVPPEDTSAEAAVDAAVSSRRDLPDIDEELWDAALRAAAEAHGACLQGRGSRAARSAGGSQGSNSKEVTAYYHAVSAAAAVLRRAHPPVKKPARKPRGARRSAADNDDDDDDDDDDGKAEIERERKRNIARNKAVLVKLGLA